MVLPFFYIEEFSPTQKVLTLNEDTSKHVVQVLRMETGAPLNLTDGKGNLLSAVITETHKKHCAVEVKEIKKQKPRVRNISIAISLVKNSSRFEWFLEKATEIGVSEIIPLICERTEKEKFRFERMHAICVSAMLQSQQCWLPVLHEPEDFLKGNWMSRAGIRLIAHCNETAKKELTALKIPENALIAIGPEGDFTQKEIDAAIGNDFQPISLGNTRLRTETAGIVAATLLCNL